MVWKVSNKYLVKIEIKDLNNVEVKIIEGRAYATMIGNINKSQDNYKFQGKVENFSGFEKYSPDDLIFNFSSDGFHIEGKAYDPKNNSSGSFWAVRIK